MDKIKFTIQDVEHIILQNANRIQNLYREIAYLEMVNGFLQLDVDRSKNIEYHAVE